MTYTMRPLHGSEVIFELVDDGGEVVAIGYEAPLRDAARASRCELAVTAILADMDAPRDAPCACGKAHHA